MDTLVYDLEMHMVTGGITGTPHLGNQLTSADFSSFRDQQLGTCLLYTS